MTIKLGIYAIFLLKVVVWGVCFKNPIDATLAPLSNFFIDVISHAHFFTYLLFMTYAVRGIVKGQDPLFNFFQMAVDLTHKNKTKTCRNIICIINNKNRKCNFVIFWGSVLALGLRPRAILRHASWKRLYIP